MTKNRLKKKNVNIKMKFYINKKPRCLCTSTAWVVLLSGSSCKEPLWLCFLEKINLHWFFFLRSRLNLEQPVKFRKIDYVHGHKSPMQLTADEHILHVLLLGNTPMHLKILNVLNKFVTSSYTAVFVFFSLCLIHFQNI